MVDVGPPEGRKGLGLEALVVQPASPDSWTRPASMGRRRLLLMATR